MPPRFPHGPDGWEQHSVSMLPMLGNFLFLLVILALVLTGLYLWRTGKLPLGNPGKRSPEEDAKRILAERFARGDLRARDGRARAARRTVAAPRRPR